MQSTELALINYQRREKKKIFHLLLNKLQIQNFFIPHKIFMPPQGVIAINSSDLKKNI